MSVMAWVALAWLLLSLPFGIVVGKAIARADRIELAAYAKRAEQ